jgi:hypothetical protein
MDHTSAASRLGIPMSEIADIYSHETGDVIVTSDGVSYVDVPADRPDGEGKTGLMYLSAPHDRYSDSFPVYAAPDVLDSELDRDGAVMTKADLIARAKELGIEANGKWGEAKLLKAIADVEAGTPPAPDSSGADGSGDGSLSPEEVRAELEARALELGIDNAAELDDDELAEAVQIAGDA